MRPLVCVLALLGLTLAAAELHADNESQSNGDGPRTGEIFGPPVRVNANSPMLTLTNHGHLTPVNVYMQIWLKTACNPHGYWKSSVCGFG